MTNATSNDRFVQEHFTGPIKKSEITDEETQSNGVSLKK